MSFLTGVDIEESPHVEVVVSPRRRRERLLSVRAGDA
jgi:hypothetical protein